MPFVERKRGGEKVGNKRTEIKSPNFQMLKNCEFSHESFFTITFGRLAQLGERCVRIAEVEGSNPLLSTKREPDKQ